MMMMMMMMRVSYTQTHVFLFCNYVNENYVTYTHARVFLL